MQNCEVETSRKLMHTTERAINYAYSWLNIGTLQGNFSALYSINNNCMQMERSSSE